MEVGAIKAGDDEKGMENALVSKMVEFCKFRCD